MSASVVGLSSSLRPSPGLRPTGRPGRASSRRSVITHAKFEKPVETTSVSVPVEASQAAPPAKSKFERPVKTALVPAVKTVSVPMEASQAAPPAKSKFERPVKTASVPVEASRAAPNVTASVGFERPNEYGYFPSAVKAAEQKRAARLEDGYTSIKGLGADAEKARYARLCGKRPEAGRCVEGFSNKLVTKPATQRMIDGSMVRSDGIILVPGNREDLITWALDPKMSGDTLGLLLPTFFIIVGAQLKQVAGVPESVSAAVGITTKLIATGLVALYWLPDFTANL